MHGIWVRASIDEENCIRDSVEGEENTFSLVEWLEGCTKQMGWGKLGLTLDVDPFTCREGGGPDVEVGMSCMGLSAFPRNLGGSDINTKHG